MPQDAEPESHRLSPREGSGSPAGFGAAIGARAQASCGVGGFAGASFIGAIVGFKVDEREDHAAYIEHWLTALRNDKRAIFEAAREAQNAADYLLAMMTDQAD